MIVFLAAECLGMTDLQLWHFETQKKAILEHLKQVFMAPSEPSTVGFMATEVPGSFTKPGLI